MKKNIIIKSIVFAVIVIALQTVFMVLEPIVTTDVSIKSQLADSDVSYAAYGIYNKLLKFSPILYIIIGLLIFRKDIFKKGEKK